MRLQPRSVAAVCACFKLLQFMDRGVQNGSPLEFDVFIQRTTASTENTSGLFGALGSIYTVGTVIGCLAAALLLSRNWVAHRLMRDGMLLWVIGVLLSAFGFWAPNGMLSFVIFSAARMLVGVGGGVVSLSWPPYVEATSRDSERSLSMTLIETGTALGAAIGFVFSAGMSATLGWGAAYIVLALLMVVLLLPMVCCEPPASQQSAVPRPTLPLPHYRPTAAGGMDGGSGGGGSNEWAPSLVESPAARRPVSPLAGHLLADVAAEPSSGADPAASYDRGASYDGSCGLNIGVHASKARWLCCMPLGAPGALAIFLVGCSCGAACLQGLQVFFPAIAVELGVWRDEVDAAIHFGGGIVAGACVGGVAHGLVAERLVNKLGSSEERAARPALEARVLMLVISLTMASGGVLAVCLSRAMAGRLAGLSLVGIVITGALVLGSLGLQIRTPLLLVPSEHRPIAILFGTLAGYAGEFSGPPLVGLLKDAWAPLCKTIEVNGTRMVDPQCGASEDNQHGLGMVLVVPSLLALVASLLWLWAGSKIQPLRCSVSGGDDVMRIAARAAMAPPPGGDDAPDRRQSTELGGSMRRAAHL